MGDSLASDLSIARLMQRLSKLRHTGAMSADGGDADTGKADDGEGEAAHGPESGEQS